MTAATTWGFIRTLRALKSHQGLTDGRIAALTGMSRSAVQARMAIGGTESTVDDLDRLAYALGVDPYVLLLDKDDAIRWVMDNHAAPPSGPRPELDPTDPLGTASRCTALAWPGAYEDDFAPAAAA